MPNFQATVSQWARRNEARLTAVFRESAQRVANEVRRVGPSVNNPGGGEGGHMPVDTGNLRRSLAISLNEMPQIREEGARFDTDPGNNISLTIARAELGSTIYLGFQANYAPYMENRYGFIRLTAQRWPQIVREAAAKLKREVEG